MRKNLFFIFLLFSFSYAEVDKNIIETMNNKEVMETIKNSLDDLSSKKHLEEKKKTTNTSKIIPDADFVNGIAILINDTPVTLYDIYKEMEEKKLTKPGAAAMLIDKALYDQEIKARNISVDIFDIDKHIQTLASQNNMNILDFKSLITQQQNYDEFKEKIKQQLIHQKLLKKIATGKLIIAKEDDLKIYYENNKDQFQIADKILVTAYVSKNKRSLQMIQKNPMFNPSDVLLQTLELSQNELNPQVKYILNTTKSNSFSIIFAQNKNYNMFYIKDKLNIKTIPFEDVKNKIFSTIMQKREQDYLKEHFETLKMTADIRIIR